MNNMFRILFSYFSYLKPFKSYDFFCLKCSDSRDPLGEARGLSLGLAACPPTGPVGPGGLGRPLTLFILNYFSFGIEPVRYIENLLNYQMGYSKVVTIKKIRNSCIKFFHYLISRLI